MVMNSAPPAAGLVLETFAIKFGASIAELVLNSEQIER